MKIGFLAMSGVRARSRAASSRPHAARFPSTAAKVIAQLPSLGLPYLAAVTPAGHQLKYFEAEAAGSEPAEIYACDLVAISTFSAQIF